jgi:hypothetical protein
MPRKQQARGEQGLNEDLRHIKGDDQFEAARRVYYEDGAPLDANLQRRFRRACRRANADGVFYVY